MFDLLLTVLQGLVVVSAAALVAGVIFLTGTGIVMCWIICADLLDTLRTASAGGDRKAQAFLLGGTTALGVGLLYLIGYCTNYFFQ